MITFLNAGGAGPHHSKITIRRATKIYPGGSIDIKFLEDYRTLILNPKQVLKLHEVLGDFIDQNGIRDIPLSSLIIGDSI